VFLLYALTIIYTLFWLFTNSLKTIDEWDASKFSLPVEFIKSGLLFDNYIAAWTELNYDGVGVPGMLFNSVWYSVGGAFVGVWFCCLTAYVISKYTFVGRNVIYTVAIIQMVLPIVGNLPATYKMYNDLNITNSPLLLIVNAGGLGGNFMILYATFQGVSNSYMEAAKIDGAGNWSIMLKIMFPMTWGTFFTVFMLCFIANWNTYTDVLLFLPSHPTLSLGVFELSRTNENGLSTVPMRMSAAVLGFLPPMILFLCFHKRLLVGLSSGGIKG
jgi:ABC-type glycerol-3-phosphate transport system permease component